jgi:hypothetical protein
MSVSVENHVLIARIAELEECLKVQRLKLQSEISTLDIDLRFVQSELAKAYERIKQLEAKISAKTSSIPRKTLSELKDM